MSFDPSGIPVSAYIGTPFVAASNIGNPPQRSPRFVPITLNWLVYWQPLQVAQIAVPIDLSGGHDKGKMECHILFSGSCCRLSCCRLC